MPAIWTTPRDWTAGELITEAIADAQWRDNLEYLKLSPVFDGTPTITGPLTLNGAVVSNSTTDATSTLTGAIQTDGGVGIVKALWVGGLTNIAGAVTLQSTLAVTGAATFISTLSTNLTATLGGLVVVNAATFQSGVVMQTTLAVAGTSTLTTLVVTGGTTLGDAAGDLLSVLATTTFGAPVQMNSTLAVTGTLTVTGTTTVQTAVVGLGLTVNGAFNATSTVNLGDNVADNINVVGTVIGAPLRTYTETRTTPAISAGALTLDCTLGTYFTVTANGNATITISGAPAAGRALGITVVFVGDGTVRTMTWPGSVVWAGGVAPTLTGTLNKRDIVTLIIENGATWFGVVVGQNY